MLDRSRRHLRRYREIAQVLARHGWGWMLDRTGLAEHVGHHHVGGPEAAPAHLREMLEELGPTFVKLGQLLSTRPDIVPEPFISELEKLQDTAPTLPAEQVLGVIESEFEVPINQLFRDFDPVPIAAASLAQVHRARLPDGTTVIVKVQRPGVRESVETDIEILYKRAKFLESHWERARIYGITDIVDEFAITIREELDYTREARNTDVLRNNLADQKYVRVPLVYWDITSTRVLTLEEMHGTKVTDTAVLCQQGLDLSVIAQRLAQSFLEQVFVQGFFHADPHPGNILVSSTGELLLVDIGQAGRLDPESRAGAVRMLLAFEHQDTRGLADEILALGITRADVDPRALTKDLRKVLRGYYDMPARSVNMGQLLTRVLDTSASHKIRLPVVFAVLGKVFSNVDSICRQLDPNFNLTVVARDYVGRAVRRELRYEGLADDFYRALSSAKTFLFELPEQMERLMRKVVEGNVRLEFKHMGLEESIHSFRASTNRISMALITGAIIIGSSLVVLSGTGPKAWYGMPIFGVAGYLLATIFGIWLIISIIASGRK